MSTKRQLWTLDPDLKKKKKSPYKYIFDTIKKYFKKLIILMGEAIVCGCLPKMSYFREAK